MIFENKKDNFSKIFKFNTKYNHLYLKALSATTDTELNKLITEFITGENSDLMSFEERKTINLGFNREKNACNSQDDRVFKCNSEEELAEITAQNYTWWRHVKK